MSEIKIIGGQTELEGVLGRLASNPNLSLDTEFLREKTYYPLLCLIQVSNGSDAFCIDTLNLDLSAFSEYFQVNKPGVTIHSCRQDVEALETAGIRIFGELFDTQIAAAFCGHGDQVSYAHLVLEICGVTLAKSQTRADWSKRPLSREQLQYAIEDVLYLDEIREYFYQKLQDLGRLDWFEEECQRVIAAEDHIISADHGWKRLKGALKLPTKHHRTAQALANWREKKAQLRNRPREWILPSKVLIEIAAKRPKSITELSRYEGLNPGVIRNSGDEILRIVEDFLGIESKTPLWTRGRILNSEQKQQVKHAMNLIRQVSEDQGISPPLIANRNEVEEFVIDPSSGPLSRGWRWEMVGAELI